MATPGETAIPRRMEVSLAVVSTGDKWPEVHSNQPPIAKTVWTVIVGILWFCYIRHFSKFSQIIPFRGDAKLPSPLMRFSQLDRITALELGHSISAVKCLSLSEEYLKDHFPRFPVMPGVVMLESMFQASMWLVRASDEFQYSSVVLREGKSLKFQGFVQPGDSLNVFCEIKSTTGSLTNLKVSGEINGKTATSGRLVVDSFNLAERQGLDEAVDDFMKHKLRLTFKRLCNQLETQNLSALADNPLAEPASYINR